MNSNEIKAWIFEEIHKTNCPLCNNSLKARWLSDEKKSKLTFEVSDPRFDPKLKNGSELTQAEHCFCSNCNWQKPTLLIRDVYKDISSTETDKYQKEKELVEKITNTLLPNHSFKVRFIKGNDYKGITLSIDNPRGKGNEVYSVCFSVEHLLELEKKDLGIFMDVVAHELAHAEVSKNPQYSFKNPYYCSCKVQKASIGRYHSGKGHDKIWHDKYDEFRERIKNEKLTKGSDYKTFGKDFVRSEYRKDDNNKTPNYSPTKPFDKESKMIQWLFGTVVFISFVSLLFYLFKKRRKTK